jgi:hypothetical protein
MIKKLSLSFYTKYQNLIMKIVYKKINIDNVVSVNSILSKYTSAFN